ncbi:hypothetical protein F4774DRAFT_415724 [Daldinia eschscholtzii]|nr:hypothetical protein F4774DRAFT_415724 [Daldinia eschscholtzii]
MAAFTFTTVSGPANFGRSGYNKDGDSEDDKRNFGRSGYNKDGDDDDKKNFGRSGYNKDVSIQQHLGPFTFLFHFLPGLHADFNISSRHGRASPVQQRSIGPPGLVLSLDLLVSVPPTTAF